MNVSGTGPYLPEFRAALYKLDDELKGSPHKWEIVSGYRAPNDAARPNKVSKADARFNPSKHGYMAAADIVPHGQWGGPWNSASWEGWAELRAAAGRVGLNNDIAWDRAHVDVSRTRLLTWLQADLGVEPDGLWGPVTEKAFREAAARNLVDIRDDTAPDNATLPVHPMTYTDLRAALRGAPPGRRLPWWHRMALGGVALAMIVAGILGSRDLKTALLGRA